MVQASTCRRKSLYMVPGILLTRVYIITPIFFIFGGEKDTLICKSMVWHAFTFSRAIIFLIMIYRCDIILNYIMGASKRLHAKTFICCAVHKIKQEFLLLMNLIFGGEKNTLIFVKAWCGMLLHSPFCALFLD